MLGLFKLDNRFERLVVTTRKRRKVHRERVARAERAVHAQGLRRRRVEGGEEGVGSVDELLGVVRGQGVSYKLFVCFLDSKWGSLKEKTKD